MVLMTVDITSDVCDSFDFVQKSSVRARHVASHFFVEASTPSMVDRKDGVAELQKRTLPVAPAAVRSPRSFAVTLVVEDTVGQTCSSHIHTARQERPNSMIENLRITSLIHARKKVADIFHTLLEVLQCVDDSLDVIYFYCLHSCKHRLDQWPSPCLHGIRDDKKP